MLQNYKIQFGNSLNRLAHCTEKEKLRNFSSIKIVNQKSTITD